MTGHGGRRKGAGRPKLLVDPQTVSLVLDAAHVAKLERWSATLEPGGLSAAVRRLIELAPEPGEESS